MGKELYSWQEWKPLPPCGVQHYLVTDQKVNLNILKVTILLLEYEARFSWVVLKLVAVGGPTLQELDKWKHSALLASITQNLDDWYHKLLQLCVNLVEGLHECLWEMLATPLGLWVRVQYADFNVFQC